MEQQSIIKHRRMSFLSASLALSGITEILEILTKKSAHTNKIFSESRIEFKNAFLKYLKFCKDKEFVYCVEQGLIVPNGRGFTKKPKLLMVYHVTGKGTQFLELVR